MNNLPLLSIVIPTKNRYETLFLVISSILKYVNSDKYELIIQDNSDENQLALKFVEQTKDIRLKYFYSSEKLSVSDNTSLAIEKVSGQYITFIGDDDFVSPYIMDVILLMKKKNIDCLFYTPGNYYWSGVEFLKESYLRKAGSMQISNRLSSKIREFDSIEVLSDVINSGAFGLGNLPRFYHGIVSRENMERVNDKFGAYIPGASPDMAISTALAVCVRKYHYINYPVSVTGVSKSSAAGLGAKGVHISSIENVSFLPQNTIDIWDSNIPKIWTGPTIYAQSMHEVLSKIGDSRIINYLKMYEYMYVFLPGTRKIVLPFINRKINEGILTRFLFYKSIFYWYLRKYVYLYFDFFKAKIKGIRQFDSVDTIEDCNSILLKIGSPFNLKN